MIDEEFVSGLDTRQLCGHDVRRSGFWPTDRARAERFVATYGGTLAAVPVGDAAIALRWEAASGQVVTATGPTTAMAFERLTQAMTL
jgi:hypothetical protein